MFRDTAETNLKSGGGSTCINEGGLGRWVAVFVVMSGGCGLLILVF